MSIFGDFKAASRSNAAPVTTALVVAMVVSFLVTWMGHTNASLFMNLAFRSEFAFSRPWTFLTYPFALDDPITVLFSCMWLWGIGGSVERDLGWAKYLVVWAVFSILCAAFVFLGALIVHPSVPLIMAGGWTAISAITVIWGTRNPTTTILLMFVIPITGKWLAWLSVGLVFFETKPPQLAPFAAIPFGLAYLFAANKMRFAPYAKGDAKFMGSAKKWERYDKSYFDEVQRREKDRAERERLRKLFEGSMNDDDKR